jgi:hypothetical protein
MADYAPSGKHAPLGLMLPAITAGAVAAGVLGYVVSNVGAGIVNALAAPGSQDPFASVARVGTAVVLGLVLPALMGVVCGLSSAWRSRNPRLSMMLSALSSLGAVAVMVALFTMMLGISVEDWSNLRWMAANPKYGVRSGFETSPMILRVLPHAIPILILLTFAAGTAFDRTHRPYCEACNQICKKVLSGRLRGALTAEGANVLLSADRLPAFDADPGEEWTGVWLTSCPTCDRTRLVTIENCKGSDPNRPARRTALVSERVLSPTQLRG